MVDQECNLLELRSSNREDPMHAPRRLFVFLLSLLPLLLGPPSVAGASPTKNSSIHAPTIPIEKYKLKNGLEVILSENHQLPRVAVNIWYHVGAANERPG